MASSNPGREPGDSLSQNIKMVCDIARCVVSPPTTPHPPTTIEAVTVPATNQSEDPPTTVQADGLSATVETGNGLATTEAENPPATNQPETPPPAPKPTEVEIIGTSWVLVDGDGPTGPVVVTNEVVVTLNFDADSLNGDSGCNRYMGSYSRDRGSLTIGAVAGTRKACVGQAMPTETAYLAAITEVDTIAATDNELLLSGPQSKLRFKPANR